MTSKQSSKRPGDKFLRPARSFSISLALVGSLAAAGCSADVTRFDKKSSFSFDDPPSASAEVAESRDPNLYDSRVARNTPPGPYGVGSDPSTVDSEPLPEPVQVADASANAGGQATAYDVQPYQTAAAPASATAAASGYGGASRAGGAAQTIEVERGDTLYGLARRHNVSLNDLMAENGLTGPMLRPGQVLRLPSTTASVSRPSSPTTSYGNESSTSPVTGGASYTVKPGDSLYAIARDNGIPTADLQRANNITNPRLLRPGQVLVIPAARTLARSGPVASPASSYESSAAEETNDTAVVEPNANRERQVAALNDTMSDATPTAPVDAKPQVANAPTTIIQSGASETLSWPVTGQIISKFGGRPDGTHNDGINLAVPLGAEVKSAEAGIVAYAGSELKGYGNLILIRHENGWVTAYAHNDQLLVKRGDQVRRGQLIAKAGRSGSVDRPQLHFELRQGSKPVDPTPFMEPI